MSASNNDRSVWCYRETALLTFDEKDSAVRTKRKPSRHSMIDGTACSFPYISTILQSTFSNPFPSRFQSQKAIVDCMSRRPRREQATNL
jgi:hypothetical protein